MNQEEKIRAKPWVANEPAKKILIIRLQAFGDTVITLPWILNLREQHPTARIDLLILEKNSDLPRGLVLFDNVFGLSGSTAKIQFFRVQTLLLKLVFQGYDVVIDLQRNRVSRWVRFWLFPKAWSEIERFSFSLAGDKFKKGIQAAGFPNIKLSTQWRFKLDQSRQILKRQGWDKQTLIVLNPAGAFVTRQWALKNYILFASLWMERADRNTKFLFLGLDHITEKASFIAESLDSKHVINLVNQLTALEAFTVLQHAQLVITEDSGLMHMAWVQSIPTLALFGSSKSYWSAPMGDRSRCLNSSDLPCGDCYQETCRFGDVHCLTRYSPEEVLEEAMALLKLSRQ